MSNDALVDVIIPVFNVELFLQRCLQSIAAQIYRNIHVIMVDDGSSDGSAAICSKFAEEDDRFVLIRQPNEGVSAARNTALSNVCGDYVVFVDADDYVEPDYIKNLLNASKNSQNTIVFCDLCVEKGEVLTVVPALNYGVCKSEKYDFIKYWCDIFRGLYPSVLISGLRFDEDILIGEDTLFIAKAIKRAENLVFIPDVLYHYVMRAGSAINSKFTPKVLTVIKSYERIFELFKDNENILRSAKAQYCKTCYNIISNYYDDENLTNKYYKLFLKDYRAYVKFYMPYVSLKKKLILSAVYIFPKLFIKIKHLLHLKNT